MSFQINKLDVLQVLYKCSKIKKITFSYCNDFAPTPAEKEEIRAAYPNKEFQMIYNFKSF